MRIILLLLVAFSITSCWTKPKPVSYQKVWGSKPVYGSYDNAKQISYSPTVQPILNAGNIYAKGNLIYQVENGRGIHVIDNTVPAQARRVGFITVNGSSQISIKGNYLYTNSYDDLVVVDISNSNSVTEVKRVVGTFPEGKSRYFFNQPVESGYYECPKYDSAVIGWKKDSIAGVNCYKN